MNIYIFKERIQEIFSTKIKHSDFIKVHLHEFGMKNIYKDLLFIIFQGHCVLEMPSGTGKTVSLLSLIIAYMKVCGCNTTHIVTHFGKLL